MGFCLCCDDINEVFEESQKMLNGSSYGTNNNSFYDLLNNCSLEEIDNKIFDYEKKRRKISKLSSIYKVQKT